METAAPVLRQTSATTLRGWWEWFSTSPLCLWSILALGFITRLVPYLRNRSLRYDEAMLSLNILNRPYAELLQPLEYDQGAPLGFLVVQKLLVELLGNSEFTLRLFPLLCGLLSLVLFARLARLLLTPPAALLACLLFAVSPKLIFYASDVKQYSSDALITIGLFLVFCEAHAQGWTGRRLLVVGVAGAVACWFSFPAAFVLAGLGTSLAAWLIYRRHWRLLGGLGFTVLLWLASFGFYYAISLRHLAHNEVQQLHWANSFMPLPPLSLADVWWFPDFFFLLSSNPVGVPAIGLVALLLGAAVCVGRRRWLAALLLTPLLFTLLASGLHLYPFRTRALVFAVPLLLILIAMGADYVRTHPSPVSPRWLRWILWRPGFLVALYAVMLGTWLWYVIRPPRMDGTREVLAYVQQHRSEGDGFYAARGYRPVFDYYAPRFGLPPIQRREGAIVWPCPTDPEELTPFCGCPRVWIVFGTAEFDEQPLQACAEQLGPQIGSFQHKRTAVHLYDFSRTPLPELVGAR